VLFVPVGADLEQAEGLMRCVFHQGVRASSCGL